MIRFVTPAVLGVNSVLNLIVDLKQNYSGYSTMAQIVFGWGLIAVLVIAAVLAARFKWQDSPSVRRAEA